MNSSIAKTLSRIFALACALSVPATMVGQSSTKPAANAPSEESPSRWDIFLGYSYLAPHGTVTNNGVPNAFQSIDWGGILSFARYFNKYVGLQVEGDEHIESQDWITHPNTSSTNSNDDFAGGSAGIIFRYPTSDITPFVHALVGGEHVGSIYEDETWGVVVTAGGGVDYRTPLFNHHLSVRVFQADYQYNHDNFSPAGTRGNFNMARLSAGVVYSIGTIAPPPPAKPLLDLLNRYSSRK